MRLKVISTSMLIFGTSVLLSATERSQAERDYDLGAELGECIAARCQIFRGFLPAELPKSGESVRVTVSEALFGPAEKNALIDVPYQAYPEMASGNENMDVAIAWKGVNVASGLPVTVIMALGNGLGVKAGEPVRVAADGRDAEIIRSLAAEAAGVSATPALFDAAVTSLAGAQNYALAGYLFIHATMTPMAAPEARVGALARMLATSSVPPGRAVWIVGFIVLDYAGLSSDWQSVAIHSLTECTRHPDVRKQLAAFGGLARIAGFDKTVAMPPVPEAARSAYRVLTKTGEFPGNGELGEVRK